MKLVLTFSFFIICSTFWLGCDNSSVSKEKNGTQIQTNVTATSGKTEAQKSTETATSSRTEAQKSTETATSHSSQESEIPAELRITSGARCEEVMDTYYGFEIGAQNVGEKDISSLYMTVNLIGDDGSVVNSVNSIVIPSLPLGATFSVSGTMDTFSQTVASCQVKFTDENGEVNFQGNLDE